MSVVKNLEIILADSYALYLKTQNYHWNVTGSEFKALHQLFEEQYQELAEAIDEIAERIRTLGEKIRPLSSFIKLATISEGSQAFNSQQMLEDLAKDQDKIVSILTASLTNIQNFHDEPTNDLIINRMKVHEKNKWMLISSIA